MAPVFVKSVTAGLGQPATRVVMAGEPRIVRRGEGSRFSREWGWSVGPMLAD